MLELDGRCSASNSKPIVEAFMKYSVILIASSVFASACMDTDTDTLDNEPGDSERLSANGLLPADVMSTTFDAAILDQAHADAIVSSSAGINTAHYVIPCALAAGHDITVNGMDDFGNPYTTTLHGVFGLADSWTTTALSATQQRFVSACVLAYTNRLGASVTISMRGPSAEFATTTPETSGYAVQEGAFFGNLFSKTGAIACKGSGNTTASGRDCAKPSGGVTRCGYAYAGTCASVCSVSSGYFVNCSYGGTSYTQPVTIFDAN
jgi:hypothetical protein